MKKWMFPWRDIEDDDNRWRFEWWHHVDQWRPQSLQIHSMYACISHVTQPSNSAKVNSSQLARLQLVTWRINCFRWISLTTFPMMMSIRFAVERERIEREEKAKDKTPRWRGMVTKSFSYQDYELSLKVALIEGILISFHSSVFMFFSIVVDSCGRRESWETNKTLNEVSMKNETKTGVFLVDFSWVEWEKSFNTLICITLKKSFNEENEISTIQAAAIIKATKKVSQGLKCGRKC